MTTRTIHVTEHDMQRLRDVIAGVQNGDDRDRPYLTALEAELNHATVVAPDEVAPDVVTMNSRVRLHDGRHKWIMTLVFPESANPEDSKISVLAPLGAALLGCKVGQKVQFRVPGGDARWCEILSILYQPEAAGHRGL